MKTPAIVDGEHGFGIIQSVSDRVQEQRSAIVDPPQPHGGSVEQRVCIFLRLGIYIHVYT